VGPEHSNWIEKSIHFAAKELLDADVLHIIIDSYHTHDIKELLTENEVLQSICTLDQTEAWNHYLNS
jgi:hypothetical protein